MTKKRIILSTAIVLILEISQITSAMDVGDQSKRTIQASSVFRNKENGEINIRTLASDEPPSRRSNHLIDLSGTYNEAEQKEKLRKRRDELRKKLCALKASVTPSPAVKDAVKTKLGKITRRKNKTRSKGKGRRRKKKK